MGRTLRVVRGERLPARDEPAERAALYERARRRRLWPGSPVTPLSLPRRTVVWPLDAYSDSRSTSLAVSVAERWVVSTSCTPSSLRIQVSWRFA